MIQITILTVDVALKLKFNEESKIRPWVVPIGLDFHVISPPSNQIQYLDIGVQFGAGEEDAVDVGCHGRCDAWEIDPTLLRSEHRLDRFDGARRLTDTGADAVALFHQTRCASTSPIACS